MATNEYSADRLQKLKKSDYEIADGEPDIRGWSVKDANGNVIGEVDDLLFDAESRKVRYMIVDLDKDFAKGKYGDVLIPIGLAELHKTDDNAVLPGVSAEQVAALPEYKDNITADDEAKIRNVFAGAGVAGVAGAALGNAEENTDFYNHEHFNEDNLLKNRRDSDAGSIPVIEEQLQVGKRTVQTGGAVIKSRIVEKPVEKTINLKEEQVYVNRTPVNKPVDSANPDAFKEGVVEMKEHAEVPVVSKEARVVEEITIGKEVKERTETVKDSVRKTQVDIEKLNDKSKD